MSEASTCLSEVDPNQIAMTNLEINPYLRKPDNPSYLRRCRNHDYNRPSRYLITISKSNSIGTFGQIVGNLYIRDSSNPDNPHIQLSLNGQAFEDALSEWKQLYPEIEIPVYQIMPDHIHICVDVKAYLKTGLSRAIARLMGKTTKAIIDKSISMVLNPMCPHHSPDSLTIPLKDDIKAFAKGYNDRIAFNHQQWERQKRYVTDNPRRYLIKKSFPDLFYRRWIIDVEGESYVAQGNVTLLKNPDIQVVRFSRSYVKGEFEAKKGRWTECSRTGGVLISPYIHPEEKDVRKKALAMGGSVIRICENGFTDRFSPQGEEFEYNGGKQLLLIAPMAHNSQRENLTYRKAQSLNAIAERIAAIDWISEEGRIRPYR